MTKRLLFLLFTLLLLTALRAKADDYVADSLHYDLNADNTATVVADASYKNMTHVEVPERINFHGLIFPVKGIGDSCFNNCMKLESVNLPNSVTCLEKGCFYNCTALTDVTIPSSVTSLTSFCFKGCTSLTSFNIPSSVTELGMTIASRAARAWQASSFRVL